MALVAYDASDASEEEMDESEPVVILKTPVNTRPLSDSGKSIGEDIGDIPKPSEKELELAELAKKEKANLSDLVQHVGQKNGKVIISVPSLQQLEDEDEEDTGKKLKKIPFSTQIRKGQSTLFTKLPPPKNSNYEPPVEPPKAEVAKADVPVKKSVPLIPHSVAKRQIVANAKTESDDEDESGGFFTMDEPELQAVPEPVGPVFQPTASTYEQAGADVQYPVLTNQQYNLAGLPDSYITTTESQMELDDVALQALQGTSGTKRKLPDDAQIVDIRGERLTYDPNLSSLKALSEEQSKGPEIPYNKLQKKKHQITYLAAQAKAREVDLKNQWAQNKSSRRQTQAKYGF